MSKVIDWDLCDGEMWELPKRVRALIALGWQPVGSIVGGVEYAAVAVVKYGDTEPVGVSFTAGDEDEVGLRIVEALDLASSYGAIDGDHHKTWVIAKMVRALCGSDESYEQWVVEQKDGADGPNTYVWSEGIAP